MCKLYCKVSETVKGIVKYPACQESMAASFRPISRPTAGQSFTPQRPALEGPSPLCCDMVWEATEVKVHNIIQKTFSIYACRCELMYCNVLYDVYFEGYNKTYHLAFTTNYQCQQCQQLHICLIIQRTKGNRPIIV